MACDALLFLVVDSHSKSFLRLVSLSIFLFAAGITAVAFFIFSRPQVISSTLTPTIRRCLFLASSQATNTKQSVFVFRIEELHTQQLNRLIGIHCAEIFSFTNQSNLKTLIAFVLNVILIMNLFRQYLLR